MGLSNEDLLCLSRWIRDHLAPKKAKDGSVAAVNHFYDLTPLRSALDELIVSPMDLDTLRYSRMEKALQRIVEAEGGNWPPDIILKAKDLIARWEKSIGPLQRVRTDLWATGGRLEGFAKPQACKAGIIDNLHYRITSDNRVAYAIAMTQENESKVSKDGNSSYTPYSDDPGVSKLMATINGEQRSTIRVLRSWRLRSSLAPAAGLRYDGLYRVTGYGVKLSPGSEGSEDIWRYTFHLKREGGQESMEKVLGIPMPDQLDDWEDYRAGPMYSPDEEVAEQMDEGVEERKRRYTISEDIGVRQGSIDSGYFSSHPSDLKGTRR
ncbi:MAG: hypothetical protein Q9168_001563 [Polycauliona sp. 1 TL-2023]